MPRTRPNGKSQRRRTVSRASVPLPSGRHEKSIPLLPTGTFPQPSGTKQGNPTVYRASFPKPSGVNDYSERLTLTASSSTERCTTQRDNYLPNGEDVGSTHSHRALEVTPSDSTLLPNGEVKKPQTTSLIKMLPLVKVLKEDDYKK
jgi:hypothetical protein